MLTQARDQVTRIQWYQSCVFPERERDDTKRREVEERWIDVELKEVTGSSAPLGRTAVNWSVLTVCLGVCVYTVNRCVFVCVCFSMHQIWVYVQANLNVYVWDCWCVRVSGGFLECSHAVLS